MALTDKLKAIGDAIRLKTGKTDLIPFNQMPQEIDEVYNAGKKAQFDSFWDIYQDHGRREYYPSAFNCMRDKDEALFWTLDTLKPKYSFGNVLDAYKMFYMWTLDVGDFMNYFQNKVFRDYYGKNPSDFQFSLKDSKDNTSAFDFTNFSSLPTLDIRKAGSKNERVVACNTRITELNLIIDKKVNCSSLVADLPNLETLNLIGKDLNGKDLSGDFLNSTLIFGRLPSTENDLSPYNNVCALSAESILNILSWLNPLPEGTKKAIYFTEELINRRFYSEEATEHNTAEWEAKMSHATVVKNWTIVLV